MTSWNNDPSKSLDRDQLIALARMHSIERQRRNRQRRVSGATLMAWCVMLISAAIVLLAIAAGR